MLTVFLLATLTLSGVLASPTAFAASTSPSFKHIDLLSGDPQVDGYFGGSMASNGGLLVVGAQFETSGGEEAGGNAYVFNSGTGTLVSSLTSPDPQFEGNFGSSVAISGSLVVVGAPGETAGGEARAGNAYAFNATTGALIESFTSPDPQNFGLFGTSVAIGSGMVLVGAPEETAGGQGQAGNVYVFNATTGALIYTLDSPNSQVEGFFGGSVAVSRTTAVVGAWGEDNQDGSAYVFDLNTGTSTESLVSPNGGGAFGFSVAISGNVTVIGAYWETTDGKDAAGNAYIFNARTGSLISELNSHPQEGAYFGFSVAIDGNTVVIGAPLQTIHESGGGTAFTFNAKTGALTHTLTNPNKNFSGFFGSSVSVSGKEFVVGAPLQIVRPHRKCGEVIIFQFGS